MADYDLAIIGGGINGAGLARDAAGRGLRVLLVEQNDLASGTSSASTKLIHGGLRYLEYGAVRLVREALHEREVLLRMAPHAIRPLRIVLPAAPALRSRLRLRLGLFLYDMLGGRKLLPATRSVDLSREAAGEPLQSAFRRGYEFSDCQVDDARLVVLNAVDACERGADIRTRTRCLRAERRDEWELLLDAHSGRQVASARVLVNAAGPWIGSVADTVIRRPLPAPVRLVKGSHIVVRRRFAHDGGYLLQAGDGRVVFALPFAQDFTLIGTTDESFVGDLNAPTPDPDEIAYLCRIVSGYFREPATPDQVIWSFAGVRSLYDDGADKPEDVTRDYVLTRRCSPSMAARSPPIAGWPKRSWRGLRRSWPRGCRGRQLRRCRAAIFRSRVLTIFWRRRCAAGHSLRQRMRGVSRAPMARALRASSRTPAPWTISARALSAISPVPNCAISPMPNGHRPPMTCYGGAASSASSPPPRSAPLSPMPWRGWRERGPPIVNELLPGRPKFSRRALAGR